VGFLKKVFPFMLLILIGVIVGIVVGDVAYTVAGFSIFGRHTERYPPSAAVDSARLTSMAFFVLERMKDDDFVALSHVAHPEFGVVFSPYATITLSTNRRFSAEQIAVFDTDNTVYVWGVLDGSGEPIELTPMEYFARFVFGRDYTTSPSVGVNHIVRSGNALENMRDVFPDIQFVDFHMPGSDGDPAEDFDWSSLRLGFEEFQGMLYLTLITHNEW